jgi:hypothetical protein
MHGPAKIGPPVVFWIDKKGTLKLLPPGNKLQILEGSYFIPSK